MSQQQASYQRIVVVSFFLTVTVLLYMASFKKATKDVTGFTGLKLIAEGSYGKVYKGRDGAAHEVALKVVTLADHDNEMLKSDITEIQVHRYLQGHPNVAEFITAFSDPEHIWIVMKVYPTSVRALLNGSGLGLDVATVRRLTSGILHGLAFMHAKGVVHCDLKPENVLVAEDGTTKIADFGLTTPVHLADEGDHVVTRPYRAPELACLLPWGRPIDLWSVACILFELLACGEGVKQPCFLIESKGSFLSAYEGPFEHTDMRALLAVVGNPAGPSVGAYAGLASGSCIQKELHAEWSALARPTLSTLDERYPRPVCAEAKDLVAQLLQLEPYDRWTASEALRAPFFEGAAVDDPRVEPMTRSQAAAFERVLSMRASSTHLDLAKRRKVDPAETMRAQLMEALADLTTV